MLSFFLKNIALLSLGAAATGMTIIYIIRFHRIVVSRLSKICPAIMVEYRQSRRVRKIEGQLVDAVDMLANGLRAGLSLQQAFQMAAVDAPSPIGDEFSFIINQLKVGRNLEDSLVKFKERVPLEDVGILVESILVLRQTGGNLIETFTTIAETIRERQRVRSKIKVVTAQGVAQALIILVFPFALGVGLYFVAPWYIEPLITTPLGWGLVVIALGLQAIGALWLKKIVTIKV